MFPPLPRITRLVCDRSPFSRVALFRLSLLPEATPTPFFPDVFLSKKRLRSSHPATGPSGPSSPPQWVCRSHAVPAASSLPLLPRRLRKHLDVVVRLPTPRLKLTGFHESPVRLMSLPSYAPQPYLPFPEGGQDLLPLLASPAGSIAPFR